MANNVINRVWNQNRMVTIEDLKGLVFQAESGGHTFNISGVDDAGNIIALSGSVAGVFLRPDNTDVAITGSASGGVVSITLPANCYDVPGRFGLTVFVTENGQKTAVYAAIGTVSRTSSGTVSPGTTADVVDLINRINTAVATIPASWTGLMADIAPTYSDAAVYPVGAYVYYNGDLYRCTTAITTAESWTAGHWTQAVLGNDVSDLKNALDDETGVENLIFVSGYYNNKTIGSVCDTVTPNNGYVCAICPYTAGDSIRINVYGASAARGWAYLDSEYHVLDNAAANAPYYDVTLSDFPAGTAYVVINNQLSNKSSGYYARKGKYPVDRIETVETILEKQTDRLAGTLSSGSDLNDLYKNGWYTVGVGSTIYNSPETDTVTGIRHVFIYGLSNPSENSNRLMIYRNSNTNVYAMRAYVTQNSAWTDWSIFANADDVSGILGKQAFAYNGSLAAGTDLNTLFLNGWYMTVYTGTFPNSPEPAKGSGRRLVYVFGSDTPSATAVRYMVYVNYSVPLVAIRNYTSNGWSDWTRLSTQEYVDDLIEKHGTHEVKSVRVLSYKPYPDDTQAQYLQHPIRGCCLCGKKLIYNVYYRSDNPYYFGALTIGSRLYQISANNKYDIVLNISGTDTPMHDLTDGDNSHFDIVDMKSSGKYLYLALRGGTGYPDITKVNGYMVAINTDDMSVIGYDTSPGKTSGLFVFEDYLIAGEQSSGWSVYKLNNGVPTRVYRYAVASLTPYEGEWQQPCAFRNNGTMYIAIARYTRGVDLYSYDETNNTATLVCRWDETALAEIGENLNVFAVKAAYPYIYATVTPKTATRTSGSNLMGIAVIDITNTSVLTYQFIKIPDAACGTIPQYYTVAADGTMTLTGFGDPAPNCLWVDNGYIYTNNEDKGIAVFKISGNSAEFIGNINIGVWPKYFDMKHGIIFASTQYDYIRDGMPLLTATRPIVT